MNHIANDIPESWDRLSIRASIDNSEFSFQNFGISTACVLQKCYGLLGRTALWLNAIRNLKARSKRLWFSASNEVTDRFDEFTRFTDLNCPLQTLCGYQLLCYGTWLKLLELISWKKATGASYKVSGSQTNESFQFSGFNQLDSFQNKFLPLWKFHNL